METKDKREYISQLAGFLRGTKTTMSVKDLAGLLNWNGFRTSYGDEFKGGRGTYTLVQATYKWLKDAGSDEDAGKVAKAFKKPDGTYAYEQ